MNSNELKPLVSVIVPCYNYAKYIEDCIGSIMNQTYDNLELIVVNDGSVDDSEQVIKELQKRYDFIYEYQDNAGVSAAYNKGLSLSNGELLAFCDADDIFVLDKIEKQVDFLSEYTEFDACYAKSINFLEDGTEIMQDGSVCEFGDVFDSLMIGKFSPPYSTKMVRKIVFNEVGYYDESLAVQDFDMWLRIAKKFKIGFIDDYLIRYREHDTNIHYDYERMAKMMFQVLDKWKLDDIYDKAILSAELNFFPIYAKNNKLKAIKMAPRLLKYIFDDKRVRKGIRRLIFKW